LEVISVDPSPNDQCDPVIVLPPAMVLLSVNVTQRGSQPLTLSELKLITGEGLTVITTWSVAGRVVQPSVKVMVYVVVVVGVTLKLGEVEELPPGAQVYIYVPSPPEAVALNNAFPPSHIFSSLLADTDNGGLTVMVVVCEPEEHPLPSTAVTE
jgi:hypothetical protein